MHASAGGWGCAADAVRHTAGAGANQAILRNNSGAMAGGRVTGKLCTAHTAEKSAKDEDVMGKCEVSQARVEMR